MRWLCLACLVASCSEPELSELQDESLDRVSLEEKQEKEEALVHARVLADGDRPPVIGYACYYSGIAPRGRYAIDELVRMKRTDLMRKLLSAPTPGGRVYAAIGLAKVGAITEEEKQILVASITDTVTVCSGCLVLEVAASESLQYYTDF